MKVIFVASVYQHLTHFHIPFIKLFQAEGNEVYAAGNGDEDRTILEKLGVVCIDITFDRDPFCKKNINAIKQLKELFSHHHFALVHVHTPIAAFLVRYVLRKNKKVKVIYTAHGFHFFKGAPIINHIIYKPLEAIAARWTDHLITINNEDYHNALKFPINKSKVSLVHGVGVERLNEPITLTELTVLRKELNISENEFVISFVAELSKNKNHHFLLRNWNEIVSRSPNVKLLIIGTGDLEYQLKEYVAKNNLINIQFIGYRKDVRKILKITHLVTLLSYREGLPKSIMEALIEGKPCIVSNIRGSRDLIHQNRNGFIINLNHDEALIEKFTKIINSKETYNKMSAEALKTAQLFLMEHVIQEYKEIYSRVLREVKL